VPSGCARIYLEENKAEVDGRESITSIGQRAMNKERKVSVASQPSLSKHQLHQHEKSRKDTIARMNNQICTLKRVRPRAQTTLARTDDQLGRQRHCHPGSLGRTVLFDMHA
jgi:hypothetical protein